MISRSHRFLRVLPLMGLLLVGTADRASATSSQKHLADAKLITDSLKDGAYRASAWIRGTILSVANSNGLQEMTIRVAAVGQKTVNGSSRPIIRPRLTPGKRVHVYRNPNSLAADFPVHPGAQIRTQIQEYTNKRITFWGNDLMDSMYCQPAMKYANSNDISPMNTHYHFRASPSFNGQAHPVSVSGMKHAYPTAITLDKAWAGSLDGRAFSLATFSVHTPIPQVSGGGVLVHEKGGTCYYFISTTTPEVLAFGGNLVFLWWNTGASTGLVDLRDGAFSTGTDLASSLAMRTWHLTPTQMQTGPKPLGLSSTPK